MDWKGKRITIQRSLKWRNGADWYTTNPKTAKSIRTIALTETLMKGLQDHKRRQLEARLKAGASWGDHDFIFANGAGEPFRFESMRRLYKGILAAAKLPKN